MVRSVTELSEALAADLPKRLRIGIGIHTGPAVVGVMGYASATYLTAVGDTVHVAARLEALTKDYETLRNRGEPLALFVVRDAAMIAPSRSPAS